MTAAMRTFAKLCLAFFGGLAFAWLVREVGVALVLALR
jgi:hypothetical protein